MSADEIATLLATGDSVCIRMPDGSTVGPTDSSVTLLVRDERAIRRVLTAGELGLIRAYVSGDIDLDGDMLEALRLLWHEGAGIRMTPQRLRATLKLARRYGIRPVSPPVEEAHLSGRLHSKQRDADAIAYHYDVSNDFYRLLLGEAMSYSCAVWAEPGIDLLRAQELKFELVARKLALRPGLRLLDAGCGWGSFAIHAAAKYGVEVTAVTLSRPQADYARQAVEQAGLTDKIEIRFQDYRSVEDGPYDAIASIGMFEHIGRDLPRYASTMFDLLQPGGRFVHHAISRVSSMKGPRRRSFLQRYVFPDGELQEIGRVVTALHDAGLEVKHAESLRDHYPLTLQAWIDRLEGSWEMAVELIGEPRCRVWRLYMSAGLLAFEANQNQVHQLIAVKHIPGVCSMSLRPGDWAEVRHASPIAGDPAPVD